MKFARKGAAGFLLILLALPAGCGSGSHPMPSGPYLINSIYAYMKAVQDAGGKVNTTVQLRDSAAPSANYLYLSSGDVLYSSLDNPPQQYTSFSGDLFNNSLNTSQNLKVMSERNLYTDYFLFTKTFYGSPEYYSQDTPQTSTSPVAYVTFSRHGDMKSVESSIALPPGFQITAPVDSTTVSRAGGSINLTWSNPDPAFTMSLDVAGSCVSYGTYTLNINLGPEPAGGTTPLNTSQYVPGAVSSTDTCQVVFILQRQNIGGVSPQFAAGSFTGAQQRTVQFTSKP